VYFFLPLFSTNYSSILPHFILPSISWLPLSLVVSRFMYYTFWEFYFLTFSVHVQTNIICVTLLSLLWWVFNKCINLFIMYYIIILRLSYMWSVVDRNIRRRIPVCTLLLSSGITYLL
jgi:hypothetical protein